MMLEWIKRRKVPDSLTYILLDVMTSSEFLDSQGLCFLACEKSRYRKKTVDILEETGCNYKPLPPLKYWLSYKL